MRCTSMSERLIDAGKVYVAGPMTGIPQFNFPMFDDAATFLRGQGFEVVSPAELDDEQARAAAMASPDGDPVGYYGTVKETWGDLLARDVKLIADDGIQAVFVLPGWNRSKGARLETFVAHLVGLTVYDMDGHAIPLADLIRAWVGVAL